MKLKSGEFVREVRLEKDRALVDGQPVDFAPARRGGVLEGIEIHEVYERVRVAREGERVFVRCRQGAFEFARVRVASRRASEHAGDLLAPMPGRVRRVEAPAGGKVRQGDVVLILEAMKMEHAIRAPRDGTVSKIFHAEGDLVEAGAVLAEIT